MSGFPRGTTAPAWGPWFDSMAPDHHSMRDQTMVTAPTFPPFKFEPRRARIDWRLLHGVDINAMMRDVDLDTLEKIVNIVAFGDIEAEDTRHLTELNFIKIFRLSQMMIEYLLYVQDCLQSSNGWMQQDRSNMDKYVQAARLRIREIEANMKMSKRELRRARKTIKTYELLAVLNDGKGTRDVGMTTAAATAQQQSAAQQPPQLVKVENPVNLAMEALLRKEVATLAERMGRATVECQALRSERDDLYQAVKDLDALVRARGQPSGLSSPQGYSRQSAEAAQAIQGFQEQLSRATMEIAKLRNEKNDLADELDRTNGDRRQLQDEKSRLLSEIASRPLEPRSPLARADSPPASDNLGSMLLEADRQKALLQDQLDAARTEVGALQKQLVKAMKDTAFGGMPQSQGPDERAMRELEASRARLERELAEMRHTYNQDVQELQDELASTQARFAEADRRISELRAAGGGMRMGGDPDEGMPRRPDLLAEYEATNDRLNQQLMQAKSERSTLAEEVEQLRMQLENRRSPPPEDPRINRDWRTEEIERLQREFDGAHNRVLELSDILRDRDATIERLRAAIRDLQAQLEESNRQQAVDPAVGRVKQQVQQYERRAAPSHHAKTSSFSFMPGEGEGEGEGADAPGGGGPAANTPTSAATTPGRPELPPRPAGSPGPPPPPVFVPPSPRQSPQALDPRTDSRWLRRIPRPAPAEAFNIQQVVARSVVGKNPEHLEMQVKEEIRVITENPYEFEDDDEEKFRAELRYELPDRRGVLSVEPHELQDLETARGLLTDRLLAVLDDEVAQFGLDPDATAITDKAYAASMLELAFRRSKLLQRHPKEVQERAEALRNALLTHLELMKRGAQQEQQEAQKQRLQEEAAQAAQAAQARLQEQQRAAAAAALGAPAQAALPVGVAAAAARGGPPGGPAYAQQQGSAAGPAMPSDAATRADVRAAGSSDGSSSSRGGSLSGDAAAPVPVRPPSTSGQVAGPAAGSSQRQLPAFPSRPPSIARSEAGTEELRSMLPPPGMQAQGRMGVVNDSANEVPIARRNTRDQGAELHPGVSIATRASSVASPLDRSIRRDASTSEPRQSNLVAPVSAPASGRASHNSSIRSVPSRPTSRPTSFSASQPPPPPEPAPIAPPTAMHLVREVPTRGPSLTSGFAPPERATPRAGHAAAMPAPAAAAVAPGGGGNMNMSIRSVKYQESDFDDEEDVMPLPLPKAVSRAMEADEYALTEDEETQQDMGIDDDEEDYSPTGAQPRIMIRTAAGSPPRVTPAAAPAPSRLGPQRTSAVTQSRGWANDEPLQAAPPAPQPASTRLSEVGDIESIHSFSQSIPRRPGAWGGSAAAAQQQAPASQRATGGPSRQQTNWNESTKSFGAATSTGGDEIQAIQDISGMESFTDSARPMGRMMAASQPEAPARPAPAQRRTSYSSELSDIEYA